MEKIMRIEKCIGEKFSENLDILNYPFGYPLIDKEIEYNRSPTCKVVDIQGIQAHTGRIIFVPDSEEFGFDRDKCPYLQGAIKLNPHSRRTHEHENNTKTHCS